MSSEEIKMEKHKKVKKKSEVSKDELHGLHAFIMESMYGKWSNERYYKGLRLFLNKKYGFEIIEPDKKYALYNEGRGEFFTINSSTIPKSHDLDSLIKEYYETRGARFEREIGPGSHTYYKGYGYSQPVKREWDRALHFYSRS